MRYKEMIEEAKAKGLTSEKEMWQGIALIDELLCEIKEEHPDLYWAVIRDQFGIFNKGHYNEEFARYDVSQIEYTNRNGEKKHGAYWTMEQIKEATKEYKFPSGTNDWDIYVAANIAHSDFCKKFDDKQILDIMYSFFFADEDWLNGNKIWEYMKLNKERRG